MFSSSAYLQIVSFLLSILIVAITFIKFDNYADDNTSLSEQNNNDEFDEIASIKNRIPRIVDGIPVTREDDPSGIVLIFTVREGEYQYRRTRCTGTLLDADTILTAAHCFDKFLKLEIFVGLYDFNNYHLDSSNNGQIFHISNKTSVHKHPMWNEDVNFGYDMSIVKLENGDKVSFTEYVKPAKLEARKIPINALLQGYGYGNLQKDTRGNSEILRKTLVVNQHTDVCLNLMRKYPQEFPDDDIPNFKFVPNSLCVVRYNHAKNTAGQPCNGDSGGPIFTKDTAGNYAVAGTLSWGTPHVCTLFTVYENTAFDRDWLDSFGDYFNYPRHMVG